MKTSITKTFFLSLLLTSTIYLAYSQSDSLRVFEMYCQMGREAKNQQNLVSALYWYEKAFNYAINKFGDNDILTATSLSFIGELQIQLGDTEKGIQNLHNSVSLCKNYPSLSPRSLSFTIETLANGYANCGNYGTAIQYYNWALEELSKGENSQVYLDPEYDKIAFSIQYCSICYHLALAYRNEQDWQSSLKYYDLIEKIAEKNLTKEKTLLLHNSILGHQNKYKQTDEFDKDTLWVRYQLSIGAKSELYMAICQSYINKNDVRNVIRYYNLAIDFALKHRDYAFAELDSNVLKYILNALHNESKKIQYINEFATICKYNRTLLYADQQDSELIQSVSLLYWSIADLYKEYGMLLEGEKYMRERLQLFESAGIVNIDYADAIIGLANWMQIYNQDYIAALELHKKHVEVVSAICNSRDDPQLQTAIEDMAGCYGAITTSIKCEALVNKSTNYDDLLSIIKCWKTFLIDLYNQLGQNYVDKILEDFSNSILKEYGSVIPNRDRYWSSDTLISSIMDEIILYIQKHDLSSADNAILELKSATNQYHQEDLYINACIKIGDIYLSELLLTRAKDIFCELLSYMTTINLKKHNYNYNIEYCQSQLAKIVGLHLGDTYWAYQILLSRRFMYGPDEIDIEKSYKDIAIYIQDQITLCSMEAQKYNFDQALAYILPAYEAFKNHRQNLLDADQMEIIILETMGDIYRSLKDYDKAKNCLNKVLALNEKRANCMTWENNTELFWPNTTYMKLANVYYDMHDYASAKDIFIKVLQYNEKWNPERVMEPASYLMGLCLKEHNYVEAKQYLSHAWNHTQNYIQKQFYTMTSNERTSFWDQAWGTQEIYGGLALSAESFFDAEYYDIVLFCKGLLLRTEQSISNIIEKTDNKNLREAYQKFFDAAKTKDSLRWIYEKDLMYLLSYIDSNIYMENISWKNIKRKIRKKDVAIEFVECWQRDNKIYAALILRKDWDSPKMISICSKEELEQISRINLEDEKWRKNSFARKDLDKRYFKKGYSLIWSKLEPYINEGDNVYFSPSGLLHQINMEVLKDSIGRQANEKYNLYRVSSTRQLCVEKPKIKYTNATLYGGLIYEMDSTQMIAQSRTYHSAEDYVASRGFVADSTMRVGWNYLPATKSEVEMIARQMYEHGIHPERYTETVGTEESFKALSGKQIPIIHLATHGFFLKDEEARKQDYFQALNLESSKNIEDNSLKRSGLILSGGQRAWLNQPIPANVEDGILLAEEIATMDLSGTDLVVLSACQTGLGEITSEGVFGLQRAFKNAGVQTLIMSLWRVNDAATSLMMQTFYEHLLSGQSKREAFAIAQQAVKEKYNDPYYWAAFIMLD